MPWTDKQVRFFAARSHDTNASPKEKKEKRKLLMESSKDQRSRAMSRTTRKSKRG